MKEIVQKAIEAVNQNQLSFCRFITANDTGETGAHQSGFYIPKSAYQIFFKKPGHRGENQEKFIKIKWQENFDTDSRAIYYGKETRNEYRLTRFGKGFPFLTDDYTGSLIIISKISDEYLRGYVFSEEEDINDFLDAFGMSPADTNNIIPVVTSQIIPEEEIENQIRKIIVSLGADFPDTSYIAGSARNIYNQVNHISEKNIIDNPDGNILSWLNLEFALFRGIEDHIYSDTIIHSFNSVDDFIDKANTILNRRKSRAGKSLEHHLSSIFDISKIKYDKQKVTEENKKPDFIFPGINEYHDIKFNFKNLAFLGAKTTCKDRWRQIISEADRIPVKHLFTLQQGISRNQLKEMTSSKVTLVVPKTYIQSFPVEYRDKIFCLRDFVEMVREKQS